MAWVLAQEMCRRGWEVTLLAGSLAQDPAAGHVSIDDVDVIRYRIPRPRFGTGRQPDAEAAAMSSVIGQELSGRWDVVHGQSPVSALAIENLVPSNRVRRRVYSLYSPASRELAANTAGKGGVHRLRNRAGAWVLNRAEGRALAHADAIHVLSEYSTQQVKEIHGPAASSKITEIPWFVESTSHSSLDRAEARQRLGWSVDGFHVITVRRLVPRMGVETLVRANALLKDDAKIWVHVIGDGPERAPLEGLVRNTARSQWVRFHGRLSDADLDTAYAAADVFVLPTTALEGFGLIILEALARGVPVIGTDVGAIPEVLGRIEPGATVRGGDAAALAEKIDALAKVGVTSQRRAALAKKVREMFPREPTLDRFEAFIAGSPSLSVRATA